MPETDPAAEIQVEVASLNLYLAGPRTVAEQGLSGWGDATARLIRRRVVRGPAEEVPGG